MKVKDNFKIALNASTIMYFDIDVEEQIDIMSKAGYDGAELWSKHIIAYINEGKSLVDLKKKLDDKNLEVANAIAFFGWTDQDEDKRIIALEQAKREMNMFAKLGCSKIAAPPMGNVANISLDQMAKNFYDLALVGKEEGIEPILEIWGFADKMSNWHEAAYIALKSGVKNPKMLIDIYHLYKGCNDNDNLTFFGADSIGMVHVNDYPAIPNRVEIGDSDRLFPNDGIADIAGFFRNLNKIGYNGYISLELFIKDYGIDDPLEVAKLGYQKICATEF